MIITTESQELVFSIFAEVQTIVLSSLDNEDPILKQEPIIYSVNIVSDPSPIISNEPDLTWEHISYE